MPQKSLPTRNLLQVSIRHTFISITSFMVLPNSKTILHKTFLLTESQAFFKPDQLSHCIHSFSQVFDECRIFDQQHNFYVKIYIHDPQHFISAYEVSIDRMLDGILCADDSSDTPRKLLHSVLQGPADK